MKLPTLKFILLLCFALCAKSHFGYSQTSIFNSVTVSNLTANGTQAKRYKVADVGYNSYHWQEGGIIQIELFHKYFGIGYEKYFVEVGYSQGTGNTTPTLRHMESSGTWHTAKITLGAITDMGTSYTGYPNKILPIYVDVRYYSNYVVKVTYMRNRVTVLNDMNQIIINETPPVVDISDFEVPIGAKSLYIAESGNVGIGTQNPWTKLDIVGRIGIRAADGGYRSEILNENSNAPTAQAFSFLNAGGQNLLSINYNGNVGIGTSTPTSSLHAVGNLTLQGASNTNYVSNILFKRSEGANMYSIGPKISSSTNSNLDINSINGNPITLSTENVERLIVLNNGNVGIGTNNPLAKLEIGGSFAQANSFISSRSYNGNDFEFGHQNQAGYGSVLGHNSSNGSSFLAFNSESGTSINTFRTRGIKGAVILHDVNTLALTFNQVSNANSDNQNLTERMRIDANGNIGIGTVAPTQKIEITGTAYINSENSGIVVDAANLSRIGFMKYGGMEAALVHGNQTPLRFGQVNQGSVLGGVFTEQMRIDNNGNVGIGTVSPSRRLHVISNSGIGVSDVAQNAITSLFTDGTTTSLDCYSGANSNFIVRTNLAGSGSTEKFRINSSGQVIIGTPTIIPIDYKLAVAGNVIAEKVKVKKSNTWPDFVFAPSYKLPNLTEIEYFIKKNSHLPGIPSAAEIEKDGQDLGEMNRLLLKKVEELTLYLIEQNKNYEIQNRRIESQNSIIDSMQNEINFLKSKVK